MKKSYNFNSKYIFIHINNKYIYILNMKINFIQYNNYKISFQI